MSILTAKVLTHKVCSAYVLIWELVTWDRLPKTGVLKHCSLNHVWIARSVNCGRKSLLPTERLLQRHGQNEILLWAAVYLRYAGCNSCGADVYRGELPDPKPGQV